jgi:hypothetical protein
MGRALACAVVLIGVLAAGCSEPLPAMYPAEGRIKLADGSTPDGGAIQFLPKGGAGHAAIGEVSADGTFSLATIIGNRRGEGALPGSYQVTFLPAGRNNQPVAPVLMPDTVTVEAKPNTFELRLP